MKVTFVIGPSGVGKSSLIEREYAGRREVFIFNIARKAKELFGSYQAMEDGDMELQAINASCSEAFMALMEGKEVVVEYYTDGFDDGLFAMTKKAKSLGVRIEVIALTCDVDEAWNRVQKAGSAYFPSARIKEDTEFIFMGILEDVEFNLDFDRICEIGGEGGTISFFRFKKGSQDRFFFTTDENGYFDFEPDYEFEKKEGVNYIEEFDNFKEAFTALLDKYPIFGLVPLEVHSRYKSEFRSAYQHYLRGKQALQANQKWNFYLN
ncbi:P-loop nucleotide/nucleoside kinase family protein [Algoriphagus taiwanensis]|uniref:Uncharacterized protein n=1 Tax=Algoriphagus taiwanensis TaxID=1445656 RepID=A0ABQ6Q5X3_9BACT|nr:hypothetical protein Ataiwa_31560 [Algoriphagus taiwanensis]